MHVEYDVQLMKRTREVPSARAEPLFFASAEEELRPVLSSATSLATTTTTMLTT